MLRTVPLTGPERQARYDAKPESKARAALVRRKKNRRDRLFKFQPLRILGGRDVIRLKKALRPGDAYRFSSFLDSAIETFRLKGDTYFEYLFDEAWEVEELLLDNLVEPDPEHVGRVYFTEFLSVMYAIQAIPEQDLWLSDCKWNSPDTTEPVLTTTINEELLVQDYEQAPWAVHCLMKVRKYHPEAKLFKVDYLADPNEMYEEIPLSEEQIENILASLP